jgi:hypothetical protein
MSENSRVFQVKVDVGHSGTEWVFLIMSHSSHNAIVQALAQDEIKRVASIQAIHVQEITGKFIGR